MNTQINDEGYIHTLPSPLYQSRYMQWKSDMLNKLDDMLIDLETNGADHMVKTFSLTRKDIALLVRLNYIPEHLSERHGLYAIERTVPT